MLHPFPEYVYGGFCMRIEEMPGCCTARVLVDFGQEGNSMYGRGGDYNVDQKELNKLLSFWKRYGIAYIIATLTERQTKGIQLLKDNGFEHTPFVEKPRHEDSKVAVFTLKLQEWEPKKVEEEVEVKKRECKWYAHRGGGAYLERITPGDRIAVKLRDGEIMSGTMNEFDWDWYGDSSDIIAYRKQEEQD